MNIVLAAAAIAYWIALDGGAWSATGELPDIRAGLQAFVAKAAADRAVQLAPWESYTFQYRGDVEDGRKFVFINAFCTPPPADVKQKQVVVLDGGPCYFQLEYDPQQRKFLDLRFNHY